MPPGIRTSVVPPRLAALPALRAQLESSSRAFFAPRDGERLFRAWGPPGRPWVVAVEPRGTRWAVEAWGAGAPAARAAVRALFSFDHPLEGFYRLVRRDPVLAGTERRFRGLRLPRDAHVYEALVHAVIGQQLSVAAARAIDRRLVERAGSILVADGIEVPYVPSPDALRGLGMPGLCATGLSRAKARALGGLAAESAPRCLDDPSLASIPLEAAVRRLTELDGVGRWTAENALLRGTGRPDVFVAGDLGVRVALDAFGGVARRAPEAAARAWAARRYPGWGSYATLYLWRRLTAERAAAAS